MCLEPGILPVCPTITHTPPPSQQILKSRPLIPPHTESPDDLGKDKKKALNNCNVIPYNSTYSQYLPDTQFCKWWNVNLI